ncbi:MAG: leucine-rich repeat protein [Oscillospiraceae bacterium]|nr:leucine-rich repeat protein [Oscillospiraceae bacterium]
MKKRLLSILLVLLTALTLLPLGALADDNNKCGENLTWKFADGILTISGTGEMYDYSEDYLAPWNEHCLEITNVTISDGVTSIGSSAFCYCSVKSITLPFGLKHIGASAFFYCPNIQQINIPDSVEYIDPYAFSCCKGLHTVQLPASLTLISEELFAECDNLRNLSIPDAVTEIGANAFLRCTEFSLTGLPDGIKSIGAAAFEDCGRIEELVLPETLEHIGEAAFNGTAIDKASFAGTPERWTAIGGNACCIAQDKIDFLEHTCDFGGSWQYDTQKHWKQCSCNKTQNEGAHTGTGKTCDVCDAALSAALDSGSIGDGLSWSLSRSGALTISGSGKMPDFSSVANAAPWDKQKDKIQSVVIESGVQSISGGAFSGCTALEKVGISDTVAQIDLNAFDGCTALAEFEVAADNKAFSSVGGVLFSADKELLRCPVGKSADYAVPSGTVAIAGGAFKDCAKLESLVIPASVTAIGKSAFENCAALKRITLPKSIAKLEALTFSGCAALAEIALPDSVKTLGEKVFSGCAALKSVKIPAEVTVIPAEAFFGCSSLESITIPKNVSHINERAFDGCTALKKVDYLGSDTDWSQVTKETCNNALDNAEKSFTRTDHEHKYADTVIPPTCTERGCTVHLCACGDKREDSYTPPLGHSYKGGICVRCGILDPNKDTQHKHDFIPIVTKPTCLTEGFTTYTCSCGECYTKDYVSAVGHKTQLQNAKAAGCLTGGYTGDEVCTVCGKVFKQGSVIFALGHDPQPARVKAPTCTESGYTGDLICMRCGDMTQIGKTVAATGHKFFGGVCSVCGAKGAEAAPEFDDVKPGAFYFDAVQWAVGNGITNGTGKNTFSPNDVCSRYQIVMFLWRAAGQPEAKAAVSFADVKPGDIFYEAVQWAVERGITKGTSSTSFSPFAPCTRGQIVTFLYRSAGSPKVSGACNFSDVSSGSFCRDAVIWASTEGITNGTSAGRFSPNEGCTRAQVVTFLYRASGGK